MNDNLTDDKMQTSMGTEEVSNVTLEDVNIDDFLPMPGAESVVTSDNEDAPSKEGIEDDRPKTVFSVEKESDLTFLDKSENEDISEADEAISELDDQLESIKNETDPAAKKRATTKMASTFEKLIEEGVLLGFEDDKPYSEYTEDDWKELLTANFEEREKMISQNVPREFFEALPDELKYAAEYVAKGGTDMKGLFRALAQVEEKRTLDPNNDAHQEYIVRDYLMATNFGQGDKDLLEDQIKEWADNGTLAKKAKQFKPKLDAMQQKVLASKLAQQEQFKKQQIAQKQAYMDNIYNTLKPGELNGLKLSSDKQKFLWDELTTVKYESLSGNRTNLLGRLLEEYQFGKNQRYDLIAEALWLLSDPQDYKRSIGSQFSNQATNETVKQLKTEQSRRLSSSGDYRSEASERRTIRKQPRNIFNRK